MRDATAGIKPSALREGALIVLVLMCGAIGGLIHAMTSFVDFAGNRQLLRSWIPWLYLRAPIASLLAVIVYLAYRAGVFGDRQVSHLGDLYQIAFAAALAGLFSKQFTDKLSDLVDNVFAPSRGPERKDALVPGATGAGGQGAAVGPPEFNDTVQAVQRLLMERGVLAPLTDGQPSDDGVLDDTTRTAVEVYLEQRGITGEERTASLGEQVDPDFWPRLLELLRRDAAARR